MIAYWERDSEWMGEGLVGAWCPSFTGATGLQLADISGRANHGVLTNMDPGTDWVASGGKGALDFDGVNDYCSLGNLPFGGLSYFSISVWFLFLSRTADYGHIFGKNTSSSSRFGLGITGAGTTNNRTNLLATMGNGTNTFGYTTDDFLADNIWYHGFYVFDGTQSTNAGKLRLFINSIQKTLTYSGTLPTTTPTNAASFLLGAETTSTFFSNSHIDDVRIYNRALTPSEIQQLYTGGRGAGMLREPPRRRSFQGVTIPRPSSNPVRRKPRKNNTLLNGLVGAWCPSLGANGTRLLDVSGRNNHGVLTNMDANTDYVPSGGKLALDFDGVNDTVTASCVTGDSYTLSVWFQFTGTVGVAFEVAADYGGGGGGGTNLWMGLFSDGKIVVSHADSNNDLKGETAIAGKWYHVCGTVTPSYETLTAYINGVRYGQSSLQVNARANNNLVIGNYGSGSFHFPGKIDDIRIYNRALTATEIRQLYQGGRGYGLKQQRIKVGFTDPSPNLNKISIRKPKKKNTLTTGLVGAWCPSLGPTGTRLRDVSGRNNHGVLTNMDPNTDWITSGGKGALDFDGVNDRVIMPYRPQFLAASLRSIAGWINVRSFDGDFQVNDVISTDDVTSTSTRGWSLGVVDSNNNNSDGTLSLIIFGTGTGNIESQISTEKLAINRWYHFAVTYDGGTLASGIEIFLDGEKQAVTATNSGTFTAPNSPTNPLWIGRRPGIGIDTNFNGQMDDIRLYNRVLTPQEINQLYVGGRGYGLTPAKRTTSKKTIYVDAPVPAKPKPAVDTSKLKQGLVGAWIPSLGPTGLRLEDRSPYKNHGTLTNMSNADWVTSGGLGALDFDGVNDYVDCGAFQSPFVSAFSISAWFNCRTLPANNNQQIVFGWGSNNIANAGIFLKVANNSNVLQYLVQKNQNGILTATTTPIIDKWIHFVVTIAGSQNNLYINSANESSGTAGTNPGTGSNFFIGSRAGSLPANGQIDDVRFYNRVLTAQEIRALYLGGRGYGFRPQRNNRYILGTETINTGGFKGAWYRRRPLMLGSGIQ